jgi:hypothetical protein
MLFLLLNTYEKEPVVLPLALFRIYRRWGGL